MWVKIKASNNWKEHKEHHGIDCRCKEIYDSHLWREKLSVNYAAYECIKCLREIPWILEYPWKFYWPNEGCEEIIIGQVLK